MGTARRHADREHLPFDKINYGCTRRDVVKFATTTRTQSNAVTGCVLVTVFDCVQFYFWCRPHKIRKSEVRCNNRTLHDKIVMLVHAVRWPTQIETLSLA